MSSKTNVIEWTNPGPDDIFWMHPNEEIRWGSAVIVNQYEAAIFMRDGKIYDVLSAGRHVVDTQNIPLLTNAFKLVMGYGETPFKAKIVYIALKQFVGKFGTSTNVKLSPKNPFPTELKTFGNYYYRVSEPILFLTQFVGGNSNFSTQDVTTTLRSLFTEQYIQELSKYSATDVYTKLEEISRKIKNSNVYDFFKQRGIELLELKIEGVELPLFKKIQEEDPKAGIALFTQLMDGQGGDYAKLVDSMKALGNSSAAGMIGAFIGVPQMLGSALQQSPPQNTAQSSNTVNNQPSQGTKKTSVDKLRELKQMLDEKLISQDDYDKAKTAILGEFEDT